MAFDIKYLDYSKIKWVEYEVPIYKEINASYINIGNS